MFPSLAVLWENLVSWEMQRCPMLAKQEVHTPQVKQAVSGAEDSAHEVLSRRKIARKGSAHRRIHRGGGFGGPDPPKFGSEGPGVRVPVNYPQAPLMKQVLYLYCMMDTAENINVWHSLAWT